LQGLPDEAAELAHGHPNREHRLQAGSRGAAAYSWKAITGDIKNAVSPVKD